eukprot:CAMPEP_0181228498 /NCGR_PEP_ID=MMETSP1096-20121128/33379_1 /TAXON_ID=156174 ORGANISM="Chrysochromulina ericina, Strain CCMP281" /NCGR_SAMPLE_ID=MMETSP1096 /ASSEMBLY_ACC=CAM_ASM_000453 /LENGTH=97 /DNA_ID=CAMNT_0023322025 /DNA_START=637 /DNA_END=930 /DNA_ORIENTATION=-
MPPPPTLQKHPVVHGAAGGSGPVHRPCEEAGDGGPLAHELTAIEEEFRQSQLGPGPCQGGDLPTGAPMANPTSRLCGEDQRSTKLVESFEYIHFRSG